VTGIRNYKTKIKINLSFQNWNIQVWRPISRCSVQIRHKTSQHASCFDWCFGWVVEGTSMDDWVGWLMNELLDKRLVYGCIMLNYVFEWLNDWVDGWLDKWTKFKTIHKYVRFKNIDELRYAFYCEVSAACVLYERGRTADSLCSQFAVPSPALCLSACRSLPEKDTQDRERKQCQTSVNADSHLHSN